MTPDQWQCSRCRGWFTGAPERDLFGHLLCVACLDTLWPDTEYEPDDEPEDRWA